MLTFHPTYKQVAGGYIPMVNIRNPKGQCVGSRVPQGSAREYRTFTDPLAAEIEARLICLRVSQRVDATCQSFRVA